MAPSNRQLRNQARAAKWCEARQPKTVTSLDPVRPNYPSEVSDRNSDLGHPVAKGDEFKLEMLDSTPFRLWNKPMNRREEEFVDSEIATSLAKGQIEETVSTVTHL